MRGQSLFKNAFALIISVVLLHPLLTAQESPFIPKKIAEILNLELSGDRSFEYIRWMSHYHRPTGSSGFNEVAKLLFNWAREFGLESAQIVKQQYNRGTNWEALSGELRLVEPKEIQLGSYEEMPVTVAVNCPSAHETAELIDIGRGISDEDFEGLELAGKAVLTSSSPAEVMETAVWKRGATGIVSSFNSRSNAIHDYPDQVHWGRIPKENDDGVPSKWAFMISPRKASMLKEILRDAKKQNKTVKIKVDIETQFHEPPEQSYVWAEVKGSEIHNQDIVLTAHIQEEKASANDDASGCASILEIGRTITRLINEGKIPRPKRDIIFWWANEISSEYQYFIDHPEERKNMLVNINQDMVGAKQSMGSRVQHITRTPYSMPSYLSDVIESIAEYVILANSSFLAATGMGMRSLQPIYSHLGTRERYNAMVVPYFDSTDHMVFCERIIGIPGVGMVNWPDYHIHSTGDDLDNVDQTQLKRNEFIVAAATLFIANAGDEDVPLLASEVYARAQSRIGKDLRTALNHIIKKKGSTYEQSYKEALNLIHQAVKREALAVESVLVFATPQGSNAEYVKRQAKNLKAAERSLIIELEKAYSLVSGQKKAPSLKLTEDEKALASKRPVSIDSVGDYFKKRGRRISAPGLHSLMAWECLNFADGINTYLDIFNAVHAEALSAGEYYYGKVTMDAVQKVLDNAVENGALILKGKK